MDFFIHFLLLVIIFDNVVSIFAHFLTKKIKKFLFFVFSYPLFLLFLAFSAESFPHLFTFFKGLQVIFGAIVRFFATVLVFLLPF